MVWEILRARSGKGGRGASALVMVALSALVLRCGGESLVRGPEGSAGQGPQTGGSGGKGGNGLGGGSATGGVGGPGMGASGGRGGDGGTGIAGTGLGGMAQGGSMPAAGMAGAASDPFAHCRVPPLIDGTTCSFEQACERLECGEPWSLQGADGCLRKTCEWDFACDEGERCIPAPVAGAFEEWLTVSCESCELIGGQCGCSCLEGALGLRAVCLPRSEFPPSRDCPIDGLSCAELDAAANAVEGYRNSEEFFELAEPIDLCFDKIRDQRRTQCGVGGQGGAGGEGGGG